MDILCVGQLAADVLVKPIEAVRYDVDTVRVDTLEVQNGGDAMNTAVCAAKLGADVAFCGRVGGDSFGGHLISVFDKFGIDTRYLKIAPDGQTCAALCCINSEGERAFFFFGGTGEEFCAGDVPDEAVASAKIVHVGGTYTMPKFDGEGAASVFKKARELGKITSMDTTFDTRGGWLDTIRPCMPYLSYFLPSLNEAKHMVGSDDPDTIADAFHGLGVENVVIKLGKDGCLLSDKAGRTRIPAMDVPVLDTTGAGDSFVAGFLTGLSRGFGNADAARLASAVSACCIGALGATAGVADYAACVELMKNQPGEIWREFPNI